MRILVTGANGFIGKNLVLRLSERREINVVTFTRDNGDDELPGLVARADFIFHLAGVNRPPDEKEFNTGNHDLTSLLCDSIRKSGRKVPVVFTSSAQADRDNPYGKSKLQAEQELLRLHKDSGVRVYIFRLPNVYGKWARPNYNSVVATFCHNITRGLPIRIDDPDARVTLVYIDDVIDKFIAAMDGGVEDYPYCDVSPKDNVTVGKLADIFHEFFESRGTLCPGHVGSGLVRKLYATYVSYLPTELFSYPVPQYIDARGVFVEMLKTVDSGQFSFFTAHPGVTRGGHYHHSKTEKFLVIKGKARFRFRHMATNEFFDMTTNGDKPEIVETVPGWTHDITNVGGDEMIVMLWANEVFDRNRPDTIAYPVDSSSQ